MDWDNLRQSMPLRQFLSDKYRQNRMSTEKRQTVTEAPEEMRQQFQGRIMCGRCGNRDSTQFTYMLPMDGRVLVQCSHCGLTFFEVMETK